MDTVEPLMAAMTEPERILYCENNVDGTIGGSYFSLLYLVSGLDRRRYHPIVIFKTTHRLLEAFRAAEVETLVWPPLVAPFTFGNAGPAPLSWLQPVLRPVQRAGNAVRRFLIPAVERAWFLRKHRIRLVHLNNSVLANHEWMLAARLARIPCVTHERGINDHYTKAARFFARGLGGIICISDAVCRQLRDHGLDFDNLVTIHNGLDPAAMRVTTSAPELRAAHGFAATDLVVVMIGNIRRWKGQDVLVRAMGQLRRDGLRARAVFVGEASPSDRDYEVELKRTVAELGLESDTIFTGYRANVADYLNMADIVVHASSAPEPFGRVLLEAMAFKKPVVAARAGAVPEIIDDGVTGLTFAPGESASLARSLTRLISDPQLRSQLGKNGHGRLLAHFHVSRNVAATVALYDRLLGVARHD